MGRLIMIAKGGEEGGTFEGNRESSLTSGKEVWGFGGTGDRDEWWEGGGRLGILNKAGMLLF